jgi:hypothetical protein
MMLDALAARQGAYRNPVFTHQCLVSASTRVAGRAVHSFAHT